MKRVGWKSQALLLPEEQGGGWGLFSRGQAAAGQEQTRLPAAQDKRMETQASKGPARAGRRWEGQADSKLSQLPRSKETTTTTTSGFKSSLGQRPDKPHFPRLCHLF